MMTAETYDRAVTEGSKMLWDKGERILEGNRLGPTDEAHVAALFYYMMARGDAEANVADMGCGFGEVSRILSAKHMPKAAFWLVNNNDFQMVKCDQLVGPFITHRADMCASGLTSGIFDLIMFNWSLCHVPAIPALLEANRIARKGCKLFVYDYERIKGNNQMAAQYLNAAFISDHTFQLAAKRTGWSDVETFHCGGDDKLIRNAAEGHLKRLDRILSDLRPVIWTAINL